MKSLLPRAKSWRRFFLLRGFTDSEREREFQRSFRFNGRQFLMITCATSAAYFYLYFFIEFFARNVPVSDPTQSARLVTAAILLGLYGAVLVFKKTFAKHYQTAFQATVLLLTWYFTHRVMAGAHSVLAGLWYLNGATVYSTLVVYFLARMPLWKAATTSLLVSALSITSAAGANAETPDVMRLVLHLTASNLLCFMTYRYYLLRERKVFLLAKRSANVAELRELKNKAEAADRAKMAFLANISHEIRTPMNGVISALSMLEISTMSTKDRAYLVSSFEAANQLLAILNDILDLSKLDDNKLKLVSNHFNPRSLVRQVARVFEGAAAKKGIALLVDDTQLNSDVVTLIGDETKLRQVVLNLMSNAIKFTDKGSVTLIIKGEPSADELFAGSANLVLQVVDTGKGIPASAYESLFHPFFQVDSGNDRQQGGTGLGLAISKQIVTQMGGDIRVSSAIGLGSTFTVNLCLPFESEDSSKSTLPLLASAAPLPTTVSSDKLAVSPSAAFRQLGAAPTVPSWRSKPKLKGRILLVEDHEANAIIAKEILSLMGLECELAHNGLEAVELFARGNFDLVLMDCEMPVMDGYEAARRIRELEAADPTEHRTPIVALTAHGLSDQHAHVLERGMDDVLVKPYDLNTIYARLQHWLSVGAAAVAGADCVETPHNGPNPTLAAGPA